MTDAITEPMAPVIGKHRNPWAVAGLNLVTLTLYSFHFWYTTNRDLRDLGDAYREPDLHSRPWLSTLAFTFGRLLLMPFAWTVITTNRRIRTAERLVGVARPIKVWVAAVPLCVGALLTSALPEGSAWLLLGAVAVSAVVRSSVMAYMQTCLNQVWSVGGTAVAALPPPERDHEPAPIVRPRTIALGLILGLVLFAIPTVVAAGAKTTCDYSEGSKVLTVTTSGEAFGEIQREGAQIQVGELLSGPRRCRGGDPTVRNTDTIRIVTRNWSFADIDLDGGPFAPGASPEADGSPEIEIEVEPVGLAIGAFLEGTDHPDTFVYGTMGRHSAVNLNPGRDHDLDLVVKSQFGFISGLDIEAGAGRDVIRPADGLGARVPGGIDAGGGPGRDLLIGSGSDDWLRGDGGDDRVLGGSGWDELAGGSGRDLIAGGSGRDLIHSSDSKRDRVRCGSGRDRLKRADHSDRLSACEKVGRH